MFLSRRTTQAEYFDSERPSAEVAEFFISLGRVNQLFDFSEPYRRLVPLLLDSSNCRSLSILDLGAGDGSLGRTLQQWATARGWTWRVVNLDNSLPALGLSPRAHNVAGSAFQLPFRDNSFDVVIASQMAHHLAEVEVTMLLREGWRVTRQALVLCDLHRNVGLYLLLWLLVRFQKHPPSFKADALLSVKRAWRVSDLARMAKAAGLDTANVDLSFGARVILHARKRTNPGASSVEAPAGSERRIYTAVDSAATKS